MKKIIMITIAILTAVTVQANDKYTLEFDNGFKTTTTCSDTIGGMFAYATSEGIVLNIDTVNVVASKHSTNEKCTKTILRALETLFKNDMDNEHRLFLVDNGIVTPLEY